LWGESVELSRVSLTGAETAVALTEDAEVVRFSPAERHPERLFHLESPEVADFIATARGVAFVVRSNEVVVQDFTGEIRGVSGPWPVRPRFLAAGDLGFLLGVEKLVLLVDQDGRELWRRHLPAPARAGRALPGTFLVHDQAGTVHAVTPAGAIHPAFRTGAARVEPFPDAGEGPGFILVEGGLLTAVHPNGATRWRYRTRESVTCTAASPDGRWLAVMAGVELIVLPLVRPTALPAESVERTSFLEFADG
jgi:hypothetical protein